MTTTPHRFDRPLAMSRTVLHWLIRLNVVFGVLVSALLIASLVAAGPVMRALGAIPSPDSGRLIFGMRGIIVVGVLSAPVLHFVYTRLLAIVETVRMGDPFVIENAERLRTIAWSIVGLELMHVAVIILANGVTAGGQKVDIGGKFSVTPWLTILLVFVLVRVFDQGARMRDELEALV
jgi:hypothetical protein